MNSLTDEKFVSLLFVFSRRVITWMCICMPHTYPSVVLFQIGIQSGGESAPQVAAAEWSPTPIESYNAFRVSDASGFVEPCDKYIDHNSLHWWVRKFKMPFQTLYGCNRIFLAFFVSLSNTGTPLFSPHLFTCIARGKYWKLKLCYLATSSFVNLSRALRNILLGSIV